jgi:hypothetical protein
VSTNCYGIPLSPPRFDLQVPAVHPTQLPQYLAKSCETRLPIRFVVLHITEYDDASHPLCLLRARSPCASDRSTPKRKMLGDELRLTMS